MKNHRYTINVSRPPEVSSLDIAEAIRPALELQDLGATFKDTFGIWEGVTEPGTEITILYPTLEADSLWFTKGRVALNDVITLLRVVLPDERFYQVQREIVDMDEWNAQLGFYTHSEENDAEAV